MEKDMGNSKQPGYCTPAWLLHKKDATESKFHLSVYLRDKPTDRCHWSDEGCRFYLSLLHAM
jgi:hypothetical protein